MMRRENSRGWVLKKISIGSVTVLNVFAIFTIYITSENKKLYRK